jgi:thiol-disulfide isomerase/thioredoxin
MRTLALAAALLGSSALGAQDVGIRVGATPPGAVIQSLAGDSVDLARWVGKTPVVLEFWATWCENCKHLEPAMLKAAAKYGKRVKFIGIAVSVNQSPALVKKYAEKHKLPFEILYDRRGDATEAYEVPATSYVVALDKQGRVVYTGLGGKQDIDAAVRKALP